MERHLPADNAAPHFLAMMVRAPRAVNLVANSAAPLPLGILVAAKGRRTVAEASPPIADAHKQMANPEFATSVGWFDGHPWLWLPINVLWRQMANLHSFVVTGLTSLPAARSGWRPTAGTPRRPAPPSPP